MQLRCTSPRTVGFYADGKTICWSQKKISKEYATFQLPCGKCVDCRLEYARQWAIRCVHEAKVHPKNCFITLTYSDECLKNPKLDYRDFQLFMKKLRKLQNDPMGYFVTGEYGEQTKRPHWHAIIFNWRPNDAKPKYKNDRGDQFYHSETLTNIWGQGSCDFSDVTFDSAGYVARYAAKKLVHGKDGEHEFDPISKKSNKHAIGKKFLEKFYADVFNYGQIVLADGSVCGIPRYYEKWFKENHPDEWLRYVTTTKQNKINHAQEKSARERAEWLADLNSRAPWMPNPRPRNEIRRQITLSKFKMLQDKLKL